MNDPPSQRRRGRRRDAGQSLTEVVAVIALVAVIGIVGLTILAGGLSQGFARICSAFGGSSVGCGLPGVSMWGMTFQGGTGLTPAQQAALGGAGARSPAGTQFPAGVTMIAPSSIPASNALFTAVLASNGTVWTNGYNGQAELSWAGTAGGVYYNTVGQVAGVTGITDIATGVEFALAVRGSDGSVWSWGMNNVGQLGTGSVATNNATPAQVIKTDSTNLLGVVEVEAKGNVAIARTSSGQVWMWGGGVTGIGSGNKAVQVTVPGGLAVVSVMVDSGGYSSQMGAGFVTSDGHVYTWGDNGNGELGQGASPPTPNAPTAIAGITNATQIWGSDGPTAIVGKSDGTFVGFGWDATNEVCDGAAGTLNVGSADKNTPVSLPALTNVKTISMSGNHTIVLKNDGTVWGCGANNYIQSSGDGSAVNAGTYVVYTSGIGLIQVPNVSKVKVAAAGWQASFIST